MRYGHQRSCESQLHEYVMNASRTSAHGRESQLHESKSGSLKNSSAGEPDGVPDWPTGVPLGAGYAVPRTGGTEWLESEEGSAAVRT